MITKKDFSHQKIKNYYRRCGAKFDGVLKEINKKLKDEIEAIIIIPSDKSFEKNLKKMPISKLVSLFVITKNIVDKKNFQKQVDKRTNIIAKSIARQNLKIQYSIIHLEELWKRFNDNPELYAFLLSKCYPVYSEKVFDSLILAIKLKEKILQKFERYLLAVCFSGSTARLTFTKKSDFDLFIVIDDTDLKVFSREELRDKLIKIFQENINEIANNLGITSNLNFQTYLLTNFWLNLRNNDPVIHTLLRDAIALFDKGIFVAWKRMLISGELIPTSTACELYVYYSELRFNDIKKKIDALITEDLYWTIIQYAQSILMLNGITTTPQETITMMKHENARFNFKEDSIFYAEELFQLKKDFEHGKIKELKASDLVAHYTKALETKKDFDNVFKNQKKIIIESMIENEISAINKKVNSINNNIMHSLNSGNLEFEKELSQFINEYEFGDNSLKMLVKHFKAKKQNDADFSLDYYERVILYIENKLNRIELFFKELLNTRNTSIQYIKGNYILSIPQKNILINITKKSINVS